MMMEDNYDKILKEIKKDLDNWSKLQLSIIGRVATLKMSVLPKLLYLFQMIPIIMKKDFFVEID